MRDQRLKAQTALGPRLAALLALCATLFAPATVVGRFANGLA